MSSYTTPARVRFPRSNVTGKVPVALAPGSFAVNWMDRKLYVGDAAGEPVRITQWLQDWQSNLAFRKGDHVTVDTQLYRARRDIPANTPFNPVNDWELLANSVRARTSEPYATSLQSGGVVSLLAGNQLQIAAGSGVIVDNTTPSAQVVAWGTFVATVTPRGAPWTAIGIDASGSVNEVALADANADWRRHHILLAYVLWNHPLTTAAQVRDASIPVAGTSEAFRDAYFVGGGAYRARGLRVAAGAGMTLALSAGTIFGLGINWRAAPFTPNTVQVAAQAPISMEYSTRLGGVSTETDLDPAQWDNAGVLSPVPAGEATIQYMSIDADGTVIVQYGQTTYASTSEALAAIPDDWAALDSFTSVEALVTLCAIVAGSGAVSAANEVFIIPAEVHGDPFLEGVGGAADSSQFFLIDGSRPMVGDMDMNGFIIKSAVLDGGPMA